MHFKTLKDHVYDYISKKITDGSLKPNEKINEKEISEDLSVSATPVREALIQLESYGYIEKIPRKGFYVKELSPEQVKEKYIVIGALDSLAATLAVDAMTGKDIKKMEKVAESIDNSIKSKNLERYFELQQKFHEIYIEKCGNTELKETLDRLKKSFIRKTYIPTDKNKDIYDILISTNDEHKIIINFFKNKEKEKLEKYIRYIHWDVKYAELSAIDYI